jgi:hypothetical protein
MTGLELRDSGDGIWDDGEWVSWAWINTHIDDQDGDSPQHLEIEDDREDRAGEPSAELLFRILAAKLHFENTLDEISPDWGAIGEAYIAECFGVKLCKQHVEGHDGRLGNDLVEIKTITPHKRMPFVLVKRNGNFSVLAVVQISSDAELDVRFVSRNRLPAGDGGTHFFVTWETMCRLGQKHPPPGRHR